MYTTTIEEQIGHEFEESGEGYKGVIMEKEEGQNVIKI